MVRDDDAPARSPEARSWEDGRHAAAPPRAPKRHVGLRLDPDVLDWFRAQGRGWQTRMNAVLRGYVEAHRRRGTGG